MPNLLYIFEIAIAFGVVIFVHELGHFWAAKHFGARVRKFAIGMGPAIVSWTRGETEYSLRWLPLGGFVDIVGEHPGAEGGDEARALCNMAAWKRIVVFAAGVTMNALLAIALFTAASLVGFKAPSPVVGRVTPHLAADYAVATVDGTEYEIEPGDRILAVGHGRVDPATDEVTETDWEKVESFEDVMSVISGEDSGTRFALRMAKDVPGREEPLELVFEGLESRKEAGDLFPRLGLEPASAPVLDKIIPGSPEDQAGLKAGDRILAVGETPIERWWQLARVLQEGPKGPVALAIERDGERQTLEIEPSKISEVELGMSPPVGIQRVMPESPAEEAGLEAGDIVRRMGDVTWPDLEQVQETVRGAAGGTVEIEVLRDDKVKTLAARVPPPEGPTPPRIGIAMGLGFARPVRVGEVEPGGPADAAGLQPGDLVLEVGEGDDAVTPGAWTDILAVAGKNLGEPIRLLIERDDQRVELRLHPDTEPMERFVLGGSRPSGPLYEPMPRIYNPLKATARGLKRTWTWLQRVYATIIQLIKGQVSTEALGGPVLIFSASYKVASYGLGTFIDFWAKLAVMLAVLNFLPIPPFDGGHAVFVLIEKVKGGPVGLKVRTWIWLAAWILVGVFFLFILWQDIMRLVG